ncbi:MAG: LPS export ABC transporter periplasmic protein LptC [Duncaniella sp.]|nr:LPS export ABC transporter periplasmic protein LptC [Bacteroides sp.]MBD5335010.1 LPS export ABC transporter periplasmic protein LptC [Bacteroides sp.]MDE6090329.1 LPS export ABC transporter periplasmic protein LptC [Duncaniella sp.]
MRSHSPSSVRTMRLLPVIGILMLMAAAVGVTGCKESNPVGMGDVNPEQTPTMLTRDVETLISDSGVIRFRIVTPIWYVYDEVDEPYWRFPEGLNLERFDNFFRQEATVVADSAVYLKNKQIWRLDGNVNITNVMNEKFLTNQLFWDQRLHKIYSDSFIHIERQDRVLEGYGFDSDEKMTRYNVRKVSGIFPANAFRGNGKAKGGDGDNPDDPDEEEVIEEETASVNDNQ